MNIRLIALLALSMICAGNAFGQGKIGTIDLRKVFDDYYKTKAADTRLKDQAADLSKENKSYMEQYQKNADEYKKLLDEANNQAVSAEERDKRKRSAEAKLLEIKELEQTIRQFEKTAATTIEEQKRQMRERILGEIKTVINSKARTAGYTMVIDTAAESINQTPVILYNSTSDTDLTAAVLDQLNATAPPASKAQDNKRAK